MCIYKHINNERIASESILLTYRKKHDHLCGPRHYVRSDETHRAELHPLLYGICVLIDGIP